MYRGTRLEMDVLVQQSQLKTARAHHVSTIRRLITTNEAEDRALTGAVSPHKSYVFSRVHLQGRAAQHVLNSVGLMYF
jgi:hypothetical protein